MKVLSPDSSPALKHQSSVYPASWNGRVPKRVKTTMMIRSDMPPGMPARKRLTAMAGTEFDCYVNIYGAVTIIFESGEMLGVKPAEFVVIEWHSPKG